MMDQLLRKLMGDNDPRGMQGIMSRGANVYRGTSNAAHSGGGIDYPINRASPTGSSLSAGKSQAVGQFNPQQAAQQRIQMPAQNPLQNSEQAALAITPTLIQQYLESRRTTRPPL